MNNGDDGDDNLTFPLSGHGGINENGGELLSDEHFAMFGNATTNEAIFNNPDKILGRSRSTHKNTGRWDPESATVEETFKSGPMCLIILSRQIGGVATNQHNFLIQCVIFFKQKYPDNWEEPLQWVNVNVLRPTGSADKLKEIIRTCRDKSYDYLCHQEPMASCCEAKSCRFQKYGVGNKDPETGRNLALTVVNTIPTTYFVGEDDNRMRLSGNELLKIDKYREKCLDYRHKMPLNISQKEWINLIDILIDEAGTIEPTVLYRKHAEELETLERFLQTHIPNMVRARGQEYLDGKVGDFVRVRAKEEKIFLKWADLKLWMERMGKRRQDILDMRAYLNDHATQVTRTEMRDWFRSSWWFLFNTFDEDTLYRWLHPDEPLEDSND